jgi:hypothetical protein
MLFIKKKKCYIKELKPKDESEDELIGVLYYPDRTGEYYIYSKIILKRTKDNKIDDNYSDIISDLKIEGNAFRHMKDEPFADRTNYKSALIKAYVDLEYWMSKFLKLYEPLDSKINSNFIDVTNPSNLYSDMSKLETMFKKILNLFQMNISENVERDINYINSFRCLINVYKERFSNSDYGNDKFTVDITERTIKNMEIYYQKGLSFFQKHYTLVFSTDNFLHYKIIPFNRDSQSLLYRKRLIKVITDAVYLLNEDIGIMNREVGVKINDKYDFSLEIDPKTIDEDATSLEDAIDKLYDKLVHISDVYTPDINNVYERLNEIYEINLEEKERNNEPSVNSEIVHKLRFALGNHPIANKRAMTKWIKPLIPKSQNKLSLEGLVKVKPGSLKEFLCKDQLTSSDITLLQFIMKSLENKVRIADDESDVDDDYYEILGLILKVIERKKQSIESYTHMEFPYHRKDIDDFLILVFHYNELVSTALAANKLRMKRNNGNYYYAIKFDQELDDRIKFTYVLESNFGIVQIIQNNPNKFRQDVDSSHSDRMYFWGNMGCGELSTSYLNKVTSRLLFSNENAKKLIMAAGDDSAKAHLIDAYNTKYYHTRCKSPGSKSLEDYRDVIYNLYDLANTIQREIDPTILFLFGSFKEFIRSVAKYDKNVTPNSIITNGNGLVVSSMYKGAHSYSEMFEGIVENIKNLRAADKLTDKVKDDINYSIRKLSYCINGLRFKFAQMAGREKNEMFFVLFIYYRNMFSPCVELVKLNEEIGNSMKVKLYNNEHTFDYVVEHHLKAIQTLNNGVPNMKNNIKPYTNTPEELLLQNTDLHTFYTY